MSDAQIDALLTEALALPDMLGGKISGAGLGIVLWCSVKCLKIIFRIMPSNVKRVFNNWMLKFPHPGYSMKRLDVVKQIVPPLSSSLQTASAFAPANIALCKYWGKRDSELNLPMTSSLSVSLGDKGTCTKISVNDQDKIILNGDMLSLDLPFAKRLIAYLDLFRTQDHLHFSIETTNNIPTGAGVASSASGFAALVLALDKLFQWQLDKKYLSILARLGSGSACRSLWQGFVKWHVGVRVDGMDSVAEPLSIEWPNFRMGLLIFSEKEKSMGSREAMQRVVATSRFYKEWPAQVADDLNIIEQALSQQDFDLLGKTAESMRLPCMQRC